MRMQSVLSPCEYFIRPFSKRLIINNLCRQSLRAALFVALFSNSFLLLANPSTNMDGLCEACDNVINGGTIQADEFGCPSPTWDPSIITSVILPTGGTGTLEYIWISTTGNPTSPLTQWTPIPGSINDSYDPGPISVTTYFRRCARRSGCTEYVGESNIIMKEAICCDNVTDGGKIAADQVACTAPFDPALLSNQTLPTGGSLALEFQWVMSTIGTPYTPSNPDWTFITNANQSTYDPGIINQTTYFIRLARRHGCFEYAGISNMVTISVALPMELNAIATTPSCFGGADGALDLSIVNGQAPYTYLWSPAQGDVQDPQNLTAGSYAVTVTDANGCTATATFVVNDALPIVVTVDATDETCLSGNNGQATVSNIQNGAPDYTYLWNDPTAQILPTATNLAPGTYTVTVTDAIGCTGIGSAVIADGTPLLVTTDAVDETCLGGNNGQVTVSNVQNGTADYTYLWDDPAAQTSATINGLVPGTYTVTVTDAIGCTGTGSAVINDGLPLSVTTTATAESCLGANNGSAAITQVTGGVPDYTYEWNVFGETDPTLSNLSPGTYTVTVTDTQGCYGTASAVVDNGSALFVSTGATAVLCLGSSDGTASVSQVVGGVAPYSYQWDDANLQTDMTATGLPAGTYNVVVNDALGCVGTGTVDVADGAPMFLTTSHTDANCGNSNDGTATVVASGGVQPYTYLWGDAAGQTTATATGLGPDLYLVTVTDAHGCTQNAAVQVDAPMLVQIFTSATNTTCFGGSNGTVAVAVLNADPNDFTYQWNNPGNSTGQAIIGLPAGTYSVTVTDTIGCFRVGTATVGQPAEMILTMDSDSASCFNGSDGTASVTVTGGSPFPGGGYQYIWNAPGTPGVSMLDDISAGIYSVTVTDANGCTAANSVEIGEPTQITTTFNSSPVTCNGFSDGALIVTAQGGVMPYSYLWNNAAASTGATINNLPVGNYSVTVTDANGCSVNAASTITQPAALAVNFTTNNVVCDADNDGSITALVTGGTTPYNYDWSNGQNVAGLINIGTGTYSLTITDENGCTVTGAASIISTSTLSGEAFSTNASCFDQNNGTASAMGQDGTQPYQYLWSNGETTAAIDSLFAGTYFVTITDGDGCVALDSTVVSSPPQLNCLASITAPITTYGGSQGAANATASGGTAPYFFHWSNGSTTATTTGLSKGTYTVTVTDNTGCECVSQITIKNPSKIGDFVWNDLNQNGIQNLGEPGLQGITVHLNGTPTGGAPISLSTLTGPNGAYAFDGLQPGSYEITVDLPANHLFSYQNIGSDLLDSDVDQSTGKTGTFFLANDFYFNSVDAAMIVLDEKVNIGDFVWNDVNHNGIQDLNEQGVQGVNVKLIGMPGNTILGTKTTNSNGYYLFTDVVPGNYLIEFTLASVPNGYVVSPKDQGSNDNIDSDADQVTGRTAQFTVFPFTLDNLTLDCGVYKECDNVTDGGVIGFNEDLCGIGAVPQTMVSVQNPTGGFGVLEYLWLQSNIPIYNGPGDPNWTPIPNSNSASYSPAGISQTTYYIRCSRRVGCNDYPGESNVVAKIVTPYPLTNIIDKPDSLCINEGGRFEAAIAGGGATYAWYFGPTATPQSAGTRIVDPVSWTTTGFQTVTLTVTRFGCSFSVSTTIWVSGCGSQPLIIIDDINAALVEQQVELTWHVAGDPTGYLFLVQRSEDGQDFENLGAISGAATAQHPDFTYIDEHPNMGENIYRIKWQALAETTQQGFSDHAMAFYQPAHVVLIAAYPNPTSGLVTVELLKPDASPAIVEVSNAFGYRMIATEIPPFADKAELDLTPFTLGVYLVRVKQEGYREQVLKVVKTE